MHLGSHRKQRRQARAHAACLALLLLLLALQLQLAGASAHGEVRVLTIDGVISPLTDRYVKRELDAAAQQPNVVVLLQLNTPGGLESSMRGIAQAMLGSPTPVVVYVAPSGARAASAGMFITIAGHIASMAPGTNIGAAHPVGLGGESDEVMTAKVTNDAAAFARAIAAERGRNGNWAEKAVRESVSITADEALEMNVIDLVAGSRQELLSKIDGMAVETSAGEVTLQTQDVPLVERPMHAFERLLEIIIDPNIAYIFFTVGMIGLIAELYNPGSIFPGISGAMGLILAFVAFGSLPINWAGILLMVIAAGLFIAEMNSPGTGLLAAGALIAFILGSLMLFTPFTPVSPALPALSVSPWLIASVAGIFVGFFILIARALLRSHSRTISTGIEALIGQRGIATSNLEPTGTVRIGGEIWSAVAAGEPIAKDETVEIIGVEGVTLTVQRLSP